MILIFRALACEVHAKYPEKLKKLKIPEKLGYIGTGSQEDLQAGPLSWSAAEEAEQSYPTADSGNFRCRTLSMQLAAICFKFKEGCNEVTSRLLTESSD